MKDTSSLSRPVEAAAFSVWLDLFRWTAAFAVLLAHLALVTLKPYATVPNPSLIFKAYVFLAGFAHQGVMVFFVLSGYLVGGSYVRQIRSDRFSLQDYTLKRLVRLWIVIVPALGLSLLLAVTALKILNGADFAPYAAGTADKLSLRSFVGTLFFANTFAVAPFAFNSPLWSLSSEFIYYFAFPAIYYCFYWMEQWKRVAGISAILLVLAALTAIQISGSPILPYFGIWLLGVVAARVDKNAVKMPVLASTVFFLATLFASRFVMVTKFAEHPAGLYLTDAVIGLSFTMLLISMRSAALQPPPFRQVHPFMASFSFSLYVVHYPVLIFLSAVLVARFGTGQSMDPNAPQTWWIVVALFAIAIAVAFGFSLVTERHTDRLRLALSKPKTSPDVVPATTSE
ncbi:acyltransferase family protein [Caulobacter segnis]